MCALVLLGLNGCRLNAEQDELYELVGAAGGGRGGKSELTVFLRDRGSRR